ncbi:hypothetical protein [Nonomuraea zeae]|uniref:Uncharacterized protein n=1 Tax=Nonomuraea zeae TaxID=1642303 RepID=A0A5S4GLY3_9ACTN|nr:hypothetical protein [Nonomuraea zeae]TMR33792.1 hypothetical protein ETD85_18800 [Nonomuraea zeae]
MGKRTFFAGGRGPAAAAGILLAAASLLPAPAAAAATGTGTSAGALLKRPPCYTSGDPSLKPGARNFVLYYKNCGSTTYVWVCPAVTFWFTTTVLRDRRKVVGAGEYVYWEMKGEKLREYTVKFC